MSVFVKTLRLDNFLSFAPGTDEFDLHSLNVLIGPNGSGKSNLIEAFELLHATPTGFAAAIRDGGGAPEWIWKGESSNATATIEAILKGATPGDLRYRLNFQPDAYQRVDVVDEVVEEKEPRNKRESDVFFYYRFGSGRPVINVRNAGQANRGRAHTQRHLERQSLSPQESVLSQRKDPDLYPELTWVGRQFERIQTFREWSFGRYVALRQPQPADLPSDELLPDARNLGVVLNELEHRDVGPQVSEYLRRFFPRYERLSTRIQGGTVQFYLHERSFKTPIPATRLSDGTIRFLALLAILLSPTPPPLVCIEEPELGLHPDALSLLSELFVKASERTQLIVTTHSDALISALTEHAESVVVCERVNGATQLRRLESNRLQTWLQEYSLGEIWRIGEIGGTL
jgi:predicted ATPase